jgi:Tfp pilus assembly protein PilN
MTTNGRAPWYRDVLVGAAVLAVVLVPLLGVQGRVATNERSITDLELRVERLRENLALLDQIDERVHEIEMEVGRIEQARADILEAICAATAHGGPSFDRCLRVAERRGPPT